MTAKAKSTRATRCHCSFRVACLTAAFFTLPAYAIQRVDLIVHHGTVVTMDGQRRILEDGAIAIQEDAIAALGTTANIDAAYESAKVIDARGALIFPDSSTPTPI